MRSTTTRLVLAFVLLSLGRAYAAPPQLNPVAGQGLRTGATTTLVLDGANLMPAPRLLLPVPMASAAIKQGATANRVEVEVRLAADVPPGIYPLRIATVGGISNAIPLSIDTLPTQPLGTTPVTLPIAVNGSVPGGASVKIAFAGTKGQRVVAEVEARRIGSLLDPALELLDPRGVPVASSQGLTRLHGDARVDVVLPTDGTYAVELRDALYQGNPPSHFRLKVGDLSYTDGVLPMGAKRGSKVTPEFVGRIAGAKPARFDAGEGDEVFAVRPMVPGLTGDAPRLVVSADPEEVETAQPEKKLQEVAAPGAVSGRLATTGEEDRFRFVAKPGTRLRFEVFANRVGSPVDPVLTLRDDKGATLASSDDRPDSVDAAVEVTVPANATAIVAAVADLHGRGGPESVYRLAATRADVPDFALTIPDERFLVPQGGAVAVRVRATRAGYPGPIELKWVGAPAGVTLENATIPAGSSEALVLVKADAKAAIDQRVARLVGSSAGKDGVVRPALLPETPLSRGRSWLRREVGVAVVEPGPIALAWTTPEQSLWIGATATLGLKVERKAGATGVVRLSLLTNQVVPRKQDNQGEDVNRALRLEGMPTIPDGKVEGEVKLIVPGDLPKRSYDLLVKAELIGANDAVVGTAVTPVRRENAIARSWWGPFGK